MKKKSLTILFLLILLWVHEGKPQIHHTDTLRRSKYQKDFEDYWQTINKHFAYFDKQRTDWNKVKMIYQPIADTITNSNDFIRFLEAVNNELYNGHVSLNVNLSSSNRLIPTGADLWVKYHNKHFIISAIRQGYNADMCGLKQGMQVTKFNNIPIDDAVIKYLPKSAAVKDNRMYEYAGNLLLAGTHNVPRTIAVWLNNKEKVFYLDSMPTRTRIEYPMIMDQAIPQHNIGYIKINNSLGNFSLIDSFDRVLDKLMNTNGLILDLRETPSGGNTTVARAIMGRFINKEMPYQKHVLPSEKNQFGIIRSWIELVSPRGKTYTKPLIILVNRWTGSMGEGIAIGFDGMHRATVIGDYMAGLLGAVYSFRLPETNIGFSIPCEKLFHINGQPREEYKPDYFVTDSKQMITKAIALIQTASTSTLQSKR